MAGEVRAEGRHRVPFTLTVYGTPKPQGSTMAISARPGARPVVVESDRTKGKALWRTDVVHAVRRELDAGCDKFGEGIPVNVTLEVVLPRPTGLAKRRFHWPTKRNADLDKLCRALLDALTAAGLWHDDAQVVELHALKRYAAPDTVTGQVEPTGATITVDVVEAWHTQLELTGVAR